MSKSLELVLGAGGVKGYFHIGLIKAIEELKIPIGKVTGVSVGAIVAALYTNGKTSDEILEMFLDSQKHSGNPLLLANAIVMPDLPSFMVGWSFLKLEKPWQEMVAKLGIKANDRLRIMACDAHTRRPVLFQGSDYNLGTALSASGALPGVFLPVQYEHSLLIDGAAYHRNPDEFCETPAIISALGFAKRWPKEPLDPLSAYYHWRELYMPIVDQPTQVNRVRNLVIEHASDDICGLSFNLPKPRCLEMVDLGYKVGKQAIQDAIASGKLEV